ncbi:MAG: HlyD family type I secretion periplasmic adaptor subunit, partial [Burkholderiaceae bacterium]
MSTAFVQPIGHKPSRAPGPVRALLARHGAVLWQSWVARKQLAGPPRSADEAAFLPASLSLQDTPMHPAPRRLSLAITALLILAMSWAVLGRVDIVAVAPGRIVVNERSKVVQPLERSVVKAILVRDGEHVQAGQALVQLDATTAQADSASARDQAQAAVSEMLRTRVLASLLQHFPTSRALSVQSAFHALAPGEKPAWSAADVAEADAQLQAEWHDVTARLAGLKLDSSHRQAELATAAAQVAKLEATLPLAQARERDFMLLVSQGYVAGHASQDKTRERVELERDLATQRARWEEARAALDASEGARKAYLAETLRHLSERESQAQLHVRLASQEQAKAAQREML